MNIGRVALVVLASGVLLGALAQQPSDKAGNSRQDSANSQPQDAGPQLNPIDEPPRSDARRGSSSSSKDRDIDISPPPDDHTHPGSLGPEAPNGVTELKPWNPHKADKDVEVGIFYFKKKNYSAAENRFREALYWQDNHAEATYRLAKTLEKMDQIGEAEKFYQRYLKILPRGEFAQDSKKALERLAAEGRKRASTKAVTSQP